MKRFLPLWILLYTLTGNSLANEAEPDEPAPAPVEPHSQSTEPVTVSGEDEPPPDQAQPITLLKNTIAPGTFRTLHWSPGLSMTSLNTPVPVLVAHGVKPGPVMCLTAAIHGDELNGIEIVRRVLHQLEPDNLRGTVIGMPIVNLDGFRRASRYMSDRRDLNRYFPGNPSGSYASRVAHSLFHKVILHCDYLLDIHTGSFLRTNLPQLRGNLTNPMILEFSRHFGGMGVLHHGGGGGTLRKAAADAGIPAITMETGGPHSLDQEAVSHGVKGVKNLLHNLDMYKTVRLWLIPQPVFYQSTWVRSNQGGIMLSKVELDEKVKKGQLLGKVIDPITNTSSDIISPLDGIVLGKALDQVVSPGFATFHIGIIATEAQLSEPIPAKVTEPELESENGDSMSSPPIAPTESAEPFQDMDS
ncbi:succinylglutamate desuccinylase/aspartoacylase family protein [Ketobacter sp.]|uniref:succinylglutamate desuccinylase/aspartoacylase family protein n=1 Tax=Ketobacter sp. TaxID=2083498 RepID=UPI000F18D25A|nr:succinylglutamate desuccinylase/aspartoacylase family protein [Ketobacter sp.]RLT93040.1 MAG: succinylglutamate desuccinylase [Ketobacter sp.]